MGVLAVERAFDDPILTSFDIARRPTPERKLRRRDIEAEAVVHALRAAERAKQRQRALVHQQAGQWLDDPNVAKTRPTQLPEDGALPAGLWFVHECRADRNEHNQVDARAVGNEMRNALAVERDVVVRDEARPHTRTLKGRARKPHLLHHALGKLLNRVPLIGVAQQGDSRPLGCPGKSPGGFDISHKRARVQPIHVPAETLDHRVPAPIIGDHFSVAAAYDDAVAVIYLRQYETILEQEAVRPEIGHAGGTLRPGGHVDMFLEIGAKRQHAGDSPRHRGPRHHRGPQSRHRRKKSGGDEMQTGRRYQERSYRPARPLQSRYAVAGPALVELLRIVPYCADVAFQQPVKLVDAFPILGK